MLVISYLQEIAENKKNCLNLNSGSVLKIQVIAA